MSNAQLLEALVQRAREAAQTTAPSDEDLYMGLRKAFADSIRISFKETTGQPEDNEDFKTRVVGNFIIVASDRGFARESIGIFVSSLNSENSS